MAAEVEEQLGSRLTMGFEERRGKERKEREDDRFLARANKGQGTRDG